MNGEYSGIDPASMDDFERALGRAQDTLGRNEPQIRTTLQKLDLDTSGLNVLREVQNWIGTARPDLRRRSETIRTERTEWGASATVPAGLTAFDETLYGKAAHDPDVYAATAKLAKAAEDGKIDEKTVAELEKRTGNATFAVALMNTLGATKFREVMAAAVKEGGGKKAERLQVALGKTLGTASSKLSNAWRDELTSKPALGWAGTEYRAVALALKHGTIASPFLLGVARKLDAWDRASVPAGIDSNVMIPLLEALGRNPAAAQDFFAGDPTTMERFLVDWDTTDGGEALGKALEAAMLTFRDHEGSPQNPSRGYLSAKLASEFVHLRAKQIKAGDSIETILKPATVGRILAGYISDVDRVAQEAADALVPAARGDDNPSARGRDVWGAEFKREELRAVMKEAFLDDKAFASVLAAQTAFSGWLLDYGAEQMSKSGESSTLKTNALRAGAGFGMITDAAGLTKIEQGKKMDEAQARNMKILTGVINTALAVPQTGTWPITAGVVGAWTGMLEDSFKGKAESDAADVANAAVDNSVVIMERITAQAMLNHGVFGLADPADPAHPWASLEGLRKGDDPRDSPKNFLKDDGKTLMSNEEMFDKSLSSNEEKNLRFNAYQRWLHEGPSKDLLQEVEGRMRDGFEHAFVKNR
ncbi:hypothetical protein [Streptosporangium carneum]|uniref:hypothetical protein n=1 Tax=Streptosporangium carneum TaxID=47481 RepID=UPI0022F333D2|nr:hypothetical protein [Streptosporangium carneum]